MNIDNFKPAIVYAIYIASTPEKVWEALTTAEFSRKYFSALAVEAELKVGGAFVVRAPDGSVHISGEVIECDPRAGSPSLERELAGAGREARRHARHLRDRACRRRRPADADPGPRPADRRRHLSGGRQGWPAILSSLKSLLETGDALAIKWSRRSGCWRR